MTNLWVCLFDKNIGTQRISADENHRQIQHTKLGSAFIELITNDMGVGWYWMASTDCISATPPSTNLSTQSIVFHQLNKPVNQILYIF